MDKEPDRRVPVTLPDRVVLVDKPVGPTSFDIVRWARRGARGRVGHAGSLDPFASGLLLLMTGQATRLSSLLMGLPKEYEMTVQFGAASTTGDPTGAITPAGGTVDAAGVVAALDRFRGRIVQKVPLTSAVKVDGEALYKKAHRGETADTPSREVWVYDIALLGFDPEGQRAVVVSLVGSGTYMRSLAADLGTALGTAAYAASLRRTRIGPFTVVDAIATEESAPGRFEETGRGVLSLDEALSFIPGRVLDEHQTRLAANGNPLAPAADGRFRAYGGGRLLGVFEGKGGVARPLAVFPGVG